MKRDLGQFVKDGKMRTKRQIEREEEIKERWADVKAKEKGNRNYDKFVIGAVLFIIFLIIINSC